MLKKICPVCDLPVTGMNYCPRCKKIVKQPYLQNVDYFLNERHPEREEECEFHKPNLEADHHGERPPQNRIASRPQGTKTQQKTGPIAQNAAQRTAGVNGGGAADRTAAGIGMNRQPGNAANPGQPSRQNPAGSIPQNQQRTAPLYGVRPLSQGTGSMENRGKKNGHATRNVLITIFVGLAVTVFGIAASIPRILNTLQEETTGYADTYEDYGFAELTDEEVIKAGAECTAYSHFPADGAAVGAVLAQAIQSSDFGYTVDLDEFQSSNYTFDELSYYESIRSFYLTDETTAGMEADDGDYVYQYVDLNYDTATGQIHGYTSKLYNKGASLEFLEWFLTAVEDSSGIAAEDRKTSGIMEEAREIVLQNQNNYIYEGMFVIGFYKGEGMLFIDVSYNDPLEAAGSEL